MTEWDRINRLEVELTTAQETKWDKVNRLELELLEAQATIRRLEKDLAAKPGKHCPLCGVNV